MLGISKSGNRNECNLNPSTRIHWRASLVPAAAVIPAPIAKKKKKTKKKHKKKKRKGAAGPPHGVHRLTHPSCRGRAPGLNWSGRVVGDVSLKKLECSKQAYALNTLAWNNVIGLWSYCVGLRDRSND